MLHIRIIPCLQLINESLVKTVNFSQPKYVGDPINVVKILNEKEVDELFTQGSTLDRISFTTVGKKRGLDTTTVSTHELTHSIFSAAEKSNQGPVIFDPDKAIDELDDFQDQVNAF